MDYFRKDLITMKKIAIVYWSGTGNTEAMANAIAEGVRSAGGEAALLSPTEFGPDSLSAYDAVAFGCPAMGAEELEEMDFAPMFESVESRLSGKNIALFGSYGWGDGEWMRTWCARCDAANLYNENGLICQDAPDEEALAQCRSLGEGLVNL